MRDLRNPTHAHVGRTMGDSGSYHPNTGTQKGRLWETSGGDKTGEADTATQRGTDKIGEADPATSGNT